MIYEYKVLRGRFRSSVDRKNVGSGEVYRSFKQEVNPNLEALTDAGIPEHPDCANTDSGEVNGSAVEISEDSEDSPVTVAPPKRRGRPQGSGKKKAKS